MEKQKTKYELYLERFCERHNMEPEEAEQLAVVKITKQYFKEEGDK